MIKRSQRCQCNALFATWTQLFWNWPTITYFMLITFEFWQSYRTRSKKCPTRPLLTGHHLIVNCRRSPGTQFCTTTQNSSPTTTEGVYYMNYDTLLYEKRMMATTACPSVQFRFLTIASKTHLPSLPITSDRRCLSQLHGSTYSSFTPFPPSFNISQFGHSPRALHKMLYNVRNNWDCSKLSGSRILTAMKR